METSHEPQHIPNSNNYQKLYKAFKNMFTLNQIWTNNYVSGE